MAHGGHVVPHIETPLSAIPPDQIAQGLSDHIVPDGASQDLPVPSEVASVQKIQPTDNPEDMTKVLATVVNVIDDDSRTIRTTSHSVGLTLGPASSVTNEPVAPIPAYNSLTADTPSLTSSQTSMGSATSSAYTSALTSRPLINSSISPSSTSSLPTVTPSSLLGSSSGTGTLSASRVTRSSTNSSASATSSPDSSILSSISSSISSSSISSSTNSSSISTSTTTSSDYYYTGGINGFGGGGSYTGTASSPTSTGSGPPPGTGPSVPPTTGKIVGGVVGSVAGVAMLLIVALFAIHRRRIAMRKARDGLPSSEGAGAAAAAGAGGASVSRSPEISRWSNRDSILTASYFAPAFMKKWRQSTQTTKTEDTLVGSERGFQKISGRKIPSVLTSGGDGYGGGYDTGSPTFSEMSMTAPPRSPVIPHSPSSQPPPSTRFGMPLDVNYTREAEETDPAIFVRSSPAKTPVTTGTGTPSISSVSAPINIPRVPPRTLSPAMSSRPDTLRSHPSYDRSSRFTESL